MSEEKCRKWAIIDIETTGVNPETDDIIDIGFVLFEDFKIIQVYQSLLRPEYPPSAFITKLTGLTESMLAKAPRLEDVQHDWTVLDGAELIAYNADFEKKFLERHFTHLGVEVTFCDALWFLPLFFPQSESLKLEKFVVEWGIASREEHRGLSDAVDMLKALILAPSRLKQTVGAQYDLAWLLELFSRHGLRSTWASWFYQGYLDGAVEGLSEKLWQEFPDRDEVRLIEEHEKKQEWVSSPHEWNFSSESVKNYFSNKGPLALNIPGYQVREGQVDLALRTGQALKNGVHAVVQAPTGTGKTLGYLIPSLFFALETKKQVLIATGTKALQKQAMTKDVPMAKESLGPGAEHLRVEKVVGASNYLCAMLWEEKGGFSGQGHLLREASEAWGGVWTELILEHGQKLNLLPEDISYALVSNLDLKKTWSTLRADAKQCLGGRCEFYKNCHYAQSWERAKIAHVIVANHALLFSWPRSQQRPSFVVIDEAHRLEEEVTKSLSVEVSSLQLTQHFEQNGSHGSALGPLFYLLQQEDREDTLAKIEQLSERMHFLRQTTQDHATLILDNLELLCKKSMQYSELYWNERPLLDIGAVQRSDVNALEKKMLYSLSSLLGAWSEVHQLLLPYAERFDAQSAQFVHDERAKKAVLQFQQYYSQVEGIALGLGPCLSSERTDDFSYSISFHAKEGFLIAARPIDIGKKMSENALAAFEGSLMTSATLYHQGEARDLGAEWMTGQLYLPVEKRFKAPLNLPAIYDYEKRVKVFHCGDVPEIYAPGYVEHNLEKLTSLIDDREGRCLLLFSSRVRFEQATNWLLTRYDGRLPLFIQGMGLQVIEEFKKAGRGILVGMEAFGEGIDVPGRTLQWIYVDKVPDLRQDLVIKERRDFFDRQFGDEFTHYYMAHRAKSLQQKLGRIMRKETDYGVAIITDPRLKKWKGRTLQQWEKMMRPYQWQSESFDVAIMRAKHFLSEMDEKSSLI
jgi:ATP-dependent DNA helicase DinG